MSAFGGKADIPSNDLDGCYRPKLHMRCSAVALTDLAIPEGQLANFSSGGGRIWPCIVFCTPPPGLGRKAG